MRSFEPPNLSGAKRLVYDAETTGLDVYGDVICGHVLTWGPGPDETEYFPVRHDSGPNYDADKVDAWIADQFTDPDRAVVGHSMKFDMHMLNRHDIEIKGRTYCTEILASIKDEHQGAYNLNKCCKVYGVQEKKGDALYEHLAELFGGEAGRGQMANFWRVAANDPLAVDYAAGDGTSTWQLFDRLTEEIAYEDLTRVAQLEMDVLPVVQRMERLGVRVDLEALESLREHCTERIETLSQSIPEDLNVRSSKQMREYFSGLGYSDWPMTKPSSRFPKGQPSFPKAYLETNEPGKKIVELREYKTLMSTFIEGMMDGHLQGDMLHATFNQCKLDDRGTVSGRFSCSYPNLQQVPKRNYNTGPLFRRLFLPPASFTHWNALDYSQAEVRLWAYYANCQRFIEGYQQTPAIDAHTMVSEMFNLQKLLSIDEDAARNVGKTINLAQIYSMGIPLLSSSLKIPVREGRKLSRMYHKGLPEVKRFSKKAERRGREMGFVRTILGRRCRFPYRGSEYVAANRVIQGSCADLLKNVLVPVDAYCRSTNGAAALVATVHDEIDFVSDGDPIHVERIKEIMEDGGKDIELPFPMTTDADTGKDWAEASYSAEKLEAAGA